MSLPQVSSPPYVWPDGHLGAAPNALSGSPTLAAWLKADALALNDGDAVTTWTDSSGNGRSPTQATAGAKPTYKASRPEFNDKPSIYFDGGDDLYLSSTGIGSGSSYSLFALVRLQYDGTGGPAYYAFDARGTNFLDLFWDSTGWNFRASGTTLLTLGAWPRGPAQLFVVTYNGTDALMYLNGQLFARRPATGAVTPGEFTVGANNGSSASSFFLGDIPELGLYTSVLSATAIRQLTRYMANKYALPIVFPVA